MKLDVLITNAEVYDGVSTSPQKVNVGIVGKNIAYVGKDNGTSMAEQHIDAAGLLLSPGFIDSHASEGFSYLRDNAADHKLYQGVTTELFGNCGFSPAPIMQENREEFESHGQKVGFTPDWTSYKEYSDKVTNRGLPINIASLTGHNTLRSGVAGNELVINDKQKTRMQQALHISIEQGSFGLSTGLIFPPGCYAETEEIIQLAKITQAHQGLYASHIRNEREKLQEAVVEALQIAEASGVRTLISHLKAAEHNNWGKIPEVLTTLEAFQNRTRQNVAVDVYPYTAVSKHLRAFLPPTILVGGYHDLPEKLSQPQWRIQCLQHFQNSGIDFSKMNVIGNDTNGVNKRRSIQQLSIDQGNTSVADYVLQLVQKNPEQWVIYHCLSKQDVDAAIMWSESMICSDSWSYPVNAATRFGDPHPRTFGAFSRFLSDYALTSNTPLTYGEAIRKITSLPALFLGFQHRGMIEQDYFADVVLMNPQKFADNATYANPRQFSTGVEHLWVNGKQVIESGNIVFRQAGKVLHHAT